MDYVVSRSSLYVVILELQISVVEEPECCDGSDEPSGVCPNRCKEVGDAYAQKMAAEQKIQKTVGALPSGHLHTEREITGGKNTVDLYNICSKGKEEVRGLDRVIGKGGYNSGERSSAVKRYVDNISNVRVPSLSVLDVMDRTEALSTVALEFKKKSRKPDIWCFVILVHLALQLSISLYWSTIMP